MTNTTSTTARHLPSLPTYLADDFVMEYFVPADELAEVLLVLGGPAIAPRSMQYFEERFDGLTITDGAGLVVGANVAHDELYLTLMSTTGVVLDAIRIPAPDDELTVAGLAAARGVITAWKAL